MIGTLNIGDIIRTTHIRFRKSIDYEQNINSFDQEYDSERAFLNGFFPKIDALVFNAINGSQFGIVVILNLKLVKMEIIFVTLQQKVFVLSNV